MRISRQSLSFSIKRLEDELETVLFLRSVNGVEATFAGNIFYQYAQNTLLDNLKIKQTLHYQTSKQTEPSLFKIAACDYIMATLGKELYNALSQEFHEQYFSFFQHLMQAYL